MKKKVLSIIASLLILIVAVSALSGCAARENTLKIYNWGEYMDDSVVDDFKAWYKTETGENITVKTKEFSTNEDMHTEISTKKADYDLVCPSDYMIEKMRLEGLLLEFDTNIVKLEGVIQQNLIDISKEYDPENKFAVPYMWGTFGIMYNKDKVTESDMTSWSALFEDNKYSGRIYMKNSVRDTYAAASIYANRASIANGTMTVKQAINFTSDINVVKSVLVSQNKNVLKYENDEGKDEMINDANDAGWLGLYWSCDAGYAMNEKSELRYAVPTEGSNVYVDSFVIPKYAKNETAANYFLKYLNTKEVAIKNMEYVGAPSPVIAAATEYEATLRARTDGFFADAAYKQNYIDMFFASDETLERCATISDFGEKSAEINEMFIGVKGGESDEEGCGSSDASVLFLVVGFGAIMLLKRVKI